MATYSARPKEGHTFHVVHRFVTRRLSTILAVGLLVGACSSGTGTDGPGATEPDGAAFTLPPDAGAPGRLPSGAKVRVVNAYAPLNGDPGPIDVYAAPWVLEGATPLITIPYGTVSPFFDPTVSDEQGNMFLSMYWAGTNGNGNQLIDQTETLKGGEEITFILTTGPSTQDSGRHYGQLNVFFARVKGDLLGQPTPNPGKGLLFVDTIGIDNVQPSTVGGAWYFGTGDGCTKTINDDTYTLTGVGPGSSATFELDPGTYAGELHAYPSGYDSFPDCSNSALIGNMPVTITDGGSAVLLIYAAQEGDLQSLFIPLGE